MIRPGARPLWVLIPPTAEAPTRQPSSAPPAGARCGRCLVRSRPPMRLGFSLHRAQARGGSGPLSARGLPGPPLTSRGARVPRQTPLQRGLAARVPHHSQLDRKRRVSQLALRCGDWAAVAGQSRALGTARRRSRPRHHCDWLQAPPVTDGAPRPAGLARGWPRLSSARPRLPLEPGLLRRAVCLIR